MDKLKDQVEEVKQNQTKMMQRLYELNTNRAVGAMLALNDAFQTCSTIRKVEELDISLKISLYKCTVLVNYFKYCCLFSLVF